MVTPGPAPGLWNIRLLTKKAFDPQVLYPTNSRGEVCGQGAHEGKPYMMMFDITRCLWQINIGLFWSWLCCHLHGCSYHNPWIQIHQPFSCHTTPVIIACTQHVVFVILTRYSQSLNSDASASLLPSKAVQPHPSVLRSALIWHGSGRRERWLWELNIRQKDRRGRESIVFIMMPWTKYVDCENLTEIFQIDELEQYCQLMEEGEFWIDFLNKKIYWCGQLWS